MWLLAMLACGGGGEKPDPVDVVSQVTSRGPYNVGFRTETVTWTDRSMPTPVVDRSLELAIWFPTHDEVGPAPRYLGLFEDDDAIEDALPADVGPAPLLVYSHGHQGYHGASSFLMTHFASHGWVVAAPNHTDNTVLDGDSRDTPIYWQRPRDISAALDHLQAHADFALDGHVVGTGHSFGGYTMFALAGAAYDDDAIDACGTGSGPMPFCTSLDADDARVFRGGLADPRIDALIPMASGDFGLFGAGGIARIDIPTLVMTGGLDGHTDETGIPAFRALEVDKAWLDLPDGGHQVFTDYAEVDSDLDVDEAWRTIGGYALAWARYTGGDTAVEPILSGERTVSEVGTWQR